MHPIFDQYAPTSLSFMMDVYGLNAKLNSSDSSLMYQCGWNRWAVQYVPSISHIIQTHVQKNKFLQWSIYPPLWSTTGSGTETGRRH